MVILLWVKSKFIKKIMFWEALLKIVFGCLDEVVGFWINGLIFIIYLKVGG